VRITESEAGTSVVTVDVYDCTPGRFDDLLGLLARLTRLPDGPGGDRRPGDGSPPGRRVVEYARWDSAEALDRARAAPGHAEHRARLLDLASAHRSTRYTVSKVVHGALAVPHTRIYAEDRTAVVLVSCLCAPGKQAWVSEYCMSETLRIVRAMPGFVSAAFHRGLDGESFFELVQWRGVPDFERALLHDTEFQEHLRVVGHYAHSELTLTEVHTVTDDRTAAPAPASVDTTGS
jgi:hypothetical protein